MSCTTSQAVLTKLDLVLPLLKVTTLLPMKSSASWSESSTSSTRVEAKREAQAQDTMRSVRLVVVEIATTMEGPDTIPMSARLPTDKEKSHLEDEAQDMSHLAEREGVEKIVMNEDTHGEVRNR